jgi:hypothetical protein
VPQAEVLERGELFFLYTPRVRPAKVLPFRVEETPLRPRDVQRFYVVLRPEGRALYRRLLVGRKRMPDTARHQRFWAEIERVERSASAVLGDLRRFEYETKTRGRRVQPAARPAGDGVYALLRHDTHSHLTYRMVDPTEAGDVQRVLGILPSASYIAAAFNPEAPPRLGRAPPDVPPLPESIRVKFGERRFAPVDPQLLDVPGLELVLIGAPHTVDAGLELAR